MINQVECLKNWNPKACDEIIASLTCSKTSSHSNKPNQMIWRSGRKGGREDRKKAKDWSSAEGKKVFADKLIKVKVEELGTISVMEQQTLVSHLFMAIQ